MGGGGGTIRSLTITLKRLHLALTNLVTFCFYLLDTFWQTFSKIDTPRGVAAVVLEMRLLEKLNIYEFFVSLENHGNAEGVYICEKNNHPV